MQANFATRKKNFEKIMISLINTSAPNFVAPKLIHRVEQKLICVDEEKFYTNDEIPIGSIIVCSSGGYNIRSSKKRDLHKDDHGKIYEIENIWFDDSLAAYGELIKKTEYQQFTLRIKFRNNDESFKKICKNYDGELCSLVLQFWCRKIDATLTCAQYWKDLVITAPLQEGCFDFSELLKSYYKNIEPKRSVLIVASNTFGIADISCEICKDIVGYDNQKFTYEKDVFSVGKNERFFLASGPTEDLSKKMEHMKRFGAKVLRFSDFDKRFDVVRDKVIMVVSGLMNSKSTNYVPKIRHNELLRICIALSSFHLPPYVILEIVDWLMYIWAHPHKKKIDLIYGIQKSIVKIEANRNVTNKKPHFVM